ncbi:non-ribosomal peptide synthetase [Streptomyces sp. NBC_00525]|uniref:non-ribosomal peptide synthetase n=1 Tax=Streptomyces sp. NBC_00525 TaxID=2903660 RepID=UPI002E803C1F|nr:amino acid adenylation domain-containing protein [Streptomyces sp. NBC_00525]WUC96550.1 amino acid adenylation domain-containing protein [Streptomyces sp. NBC_00525]
MTTPPPFDTAALRLHEAVAARAAREPGRPAVEDGDTVLTYGELDALARAHAGALHCPPGSLVAVALPRGADCVAAVLGVLHAGCTFLPTDPAVPAARRTAILSDASPAAVLTGPPDAAPAPRRHPATDPDTPAYCTYTSGSTGTPKGALLTHEGLRVVAQAQRDVLGARPGDRVAQFASPGFDAFVFELTMALAHGGTLVIVPEDIRADPHALAGFLRGRAVSFTVLPSVVTAGLSTAAPVRSLRAAASAGDVLPPHVVRDWPHPGPLYNLYGPTEATIWSTAHRCDPADPASAVPIGTPVPGVGVHLVDGEILISGPTLARGYLHRTGLTAERFPVVDGVRMYRTGDLGRLRADGAVEFLGRRDHQVKVRGFRVELGDIEAALRTHPDVTDAVALMNEDHLVAYTVPETAADLRAHLAARLPGHMVPARVHALPAFPLTPSGKADRAALAAVQHTPAASPQPLTGAEQAVAAEWREVLGTVCGVHETFQACGGHSLSAVRLANRLNHKLGTRLTALDILEDSTIAGLARHVDDPAHREPDPVAPAAADCPGPASAAQQQVAYAIEADGRTRAYLARARLTLRGTLDVPALHRALEDITRRHEILRTRFVLRDGELVQLTEESAPVTLDVHEGPEEPVWDALVEDVLDPTTLPLARWALIRRAPDEHLLLHAEHHYVHDGWSHQVFLTELADLYSGRHPQEPVQFAAFTQWQRQWLGSPEATAQEEHWQRLLRDAPATPALAPLGPGTGTARGRLLRRRLPPAVTRRVADLAAELRLTPFQVMFGTFALLLSRQTRSTDLLLGTTVANRNHAAWERVIGMIVNTVPVRVRSPRAERAGDYLRQARDGLLDSLRAAELPLSRIVAATGTPAPTILFSQHSTFDEPPAFRDLTVEAEVALANDTAKFPLNVTVVPHPENGVEVLFEYAPHRWDDTKAERLATAYTDLLASLTAALPLEEADRFLPDLGAGAPGNTYGTAWRGGIPARFAAQAAHHPDRTAVVAGNHRWTYATLLRRSGDYAAHLTALGVRPGDLVGIRLDRGPELPAAMLGVLRTGAAYVPLDPDQPAARTDALAEQARTVHVIDTPAPPGTPGPDAPLSPETPAYCSFTSGSTGRPKGVLVPHAAVENVLDFFHDRAPDRFTRVLAPTPAAFDIANLELLLPLCHGGTVIVADRDQARDGEELLALASRERVTVIQATPSTWRLLTAAPSWTAAGPSGPLLALSGGEALPSALAAAIRTGADELWNVYGPTETTIWSTWHRSTGTATGPYEPIGNPIARTAVHLLGPDGTPVPAGETGEMYIGGAGVALGYLHEPHLTERAFRPDPFAPTPARMYRTGDLARRGPHGLEFIGRTDDQVKINGHRVEPGETEAALRAEPGIRDAAVVTRTNALGESDLLAFVTAHDRDLDTTALRTRLADRLPGYLLPAAIHRVDAFPLTPNGKLDRRALRAGVRPDPQGHPPAADEDRLTRLIHRVDPACPGDPHATFTALGLHSLALLRLTVLCRDAYGLPLTVTEVRDCATPAALARLLADRSATTASYSHAGPPREELHRAASGTAPVLSRAQEALWVLCQDPRADAAYHIHLGFQLTGDLDTDALHAALRRVVERHDALRTTCTTGPDLTPLPRIGPARVGADDGTPFDLAEGPLIRAALIRETEHTHRLTLTLHHLVADAWSLEILLRELATLYEAFSRGRPDPLPTPPVRYTDYAAWERERAGRQEKDERFWLDTLTGAPTVLTLPTDRPRPPGRDHRGALVTRTLGPDLTRALARFGERHGTTAFETLTASWAALLSRLSDQTDLVIGTPVARRDHAAVQDLIGYFVNPVALRLDVAGNPTAAAFAARVRATVRDALAHADLPFDRVVDLVAPPRTAAHSPLFQCFLSWQERPASFTLPGLTTRPLPRPAHTTAKFDLALQLTDLGQHGIAAELEYATALFDEAGANRHLDCWLVLLEALLDDDQLLLDDLPLLTPQEERRQLQAFNGPVTTPPTQCLHTLVAEQAARVPDRPAVRHEDDTLTYRQLDHRANRLAHRLRDLGVGPGDRVAICLDRGTTLVVAVLAVLKSGAAYVPLEPGQPAARARLTLTGCAPAALIADPAHAAELLGDPGDPGAPGGPQGDSTAARPPVIDPRGPLPESTEPVRSAAAPHDVAYVIHTSGSTGTPKGVQVEHRNAVALLAHWRPRLPRQDGFAASMWSGIGFDVSVLELFAALTTGATLHLVPETIRLDTDAMTAWLREHGIQHAYLPPFAVRALCPGDLTGLHTLLVGVEPLNEAHLHRLADATPGLRVVNAYGPTEATVLCTTYDTIGPHDRNAPIGLPVPGTRAYVLDRRLRPVPHGTPGELCVSGDQVARGYLGHEGPALTDDPLTDDPFTEDPFNGGRMYRTGDLVRRLPDGPLEFLGRLDDQIKIRGYRVEPGEVAAAATAHDAVTEARVLLTEAALTLYYTGALAPAALREHLRTRLPGPMVPAHCVRLAALPLLPSGKLDRAALPAPETVRTAGSPARGETETALAALWTKILGTTEPCREDDFFALGGHSLAAVRLTAMVGAEFDVDLTLGDVFEHPTLMAMALRIVDLGLAAFHPEDLAVLLDELGQEPS